MNADTVKHVSRTLMLDPRNFFGQFWSCDEGDIAIGGSCAYRGTEPGMRLMHSGDFGLPEYHHSWLCAWYNRTANWQDLDTTVTCLTPEASPPGPPGCDCPEYQPTADRIVRVAQSAPFQSYSVNEITAVCLPGSVLLAGGCAHHGSTVGSAYNMTLSRSGLAADDTNTWHCAWNSPVQTTGGELMLATVYCLQPPTYGQDSLQGRLTQATESQTIPANGNASFTASCAPGDFLLSGSCMLDSADPLSHEAITYHHGFDVTDPTAWRCAWSNPTELPIPATATATCATNPGESAAARAATRW